MKISQSEKDRLLSNPKAILVAPVVVAPGFVALIPALEDWSPCLWAATAESARARAREWLEGLEVPPPPTMILKVEWHYSDGTMASRFHQMPSGPISCETFGRTGNTRLRVPDIPESLPYLGVPIGGRLEVCREY